MKPFRRLNRRRQPAMAVKIYTHTKSRTKSVQQKESDESIESQSHSHSEEEDLMDSSADSNVSTTDESKIDDTNTGANNKKRSMPQIKISPSTREYLTGLVLPPSYDQTDFGSVGAL